MGCDVCIGTTDYDHADLYFASMPKARKPHACCECGNSIQPGQSYERVVMMWNGSFLRYDTCGLCREIRTAFVCGDGWMFGSIWDDMREYAFPHLTTASECFRELSAAAKERVLEEWRAWKGIQ